jgi:hypothetical protein
MAPDRPQDCRGLRHAPAPQPSGKLFTIIDQIEHGHHVFRVYQKRNSQAV